MAICRECKKKEADGDRPYCLDCTTELILSYSQQHKELSVWAMCAELNVPYLKEYMPRGGQEQSVSMYLQRLNKAGVVGTFADSDTHLYELYLKPKAKAKAVETIDTKPYEDEIALLKERVAQLEAENSDLKASSKEDVIDYDMAVRTWGDDYTDEEYKLLDDIFNTYTYEIDKLTPPMRFRYQDLAKLELRRRQLGSNADPKESKTIADELGKLYDMLGINNFEASQKTDEERFIDRLCWEIENTEPAEVEDLEKYKDFSGMEEPFKDVMRCVLNATAGQKEFPELKGDMLDE